MQAYEYKCPLCDKIEAHDMNMNDSLLCADDHPATFMNRVFSFGGFILKGSGWAKKDK